MTAGLRRGVLDTSVLIARESGRVHDSTSVPPETAISVITLGELRLGIPAAADDATRARRIRSLHGVRTIEVLPVDDAVAERWALLRMSVARLGRRVNVNDLWIAATALSRDIPVVTQDADFDAIEGIAGLVVIRV